jgi:DNA-binding MarR family transcriptional regulator
MAAWRAFLEAHASITRRLEADLRREKDFPLAWYDALVQLNEAEGVLRMSELADRLLLSRSATSRFAERLERAGLVRRSPVSADGRGRVITLTDDGRARLRDATKTHVRGVVDYFAAHLDSEDAERLATILRRMSVR